MTDQEYDATLAAKVEQIAKACHGVNRAYCVHALNDFSLADWEDTSEAQRESVRAGVRALMDRPHMTPADQHQAWRQYKEHEGWVWGTKKDAEFKTHPNLMPYEELPARERVKDALFQAVVRAFIPALEPVDGIAEPVSAQ